MATRNTTRKNIKHLKGTKIAGGAGVLLVLIAVLITLNSSFFHISWLPKWSDLYASFGVLEGKPIGGDVTVHFIDVGQGDCELIMTPTANILIDSGEKDYADKVSNYLKVQGVATLDYVFTTHPHSDHIGGMPVILPQFEVKNLVMPKVSKAMTPTTKTFEKLLTTVEQQDIDLMYAEPNKTIDLESGGKIEIFAPLNDTYEGLNDFSIVFRFTYGTTSFLFTGDIEAASESDILKSEVDISATVLKIPHHGSSTSSKRKFIEAVNPKYGIIEVGSPNSYNHPNDKVLKRYADANTKIFRTDINGNIVFNCKKDSYEILLERQDNNVYN